MYNTKYQIFFRSVNNELYIIQIKENNYSGNIIELTGGVSPFIINYDSDSEFLYNPLRFSGGTLKVVGSDYLQSLFSTNYQQYKINLLDNSNNIIWTGFITPELYSQEYSGFNFELEIECISALATLEYFKFEKTSETISLFQLIKDSINKSKGDYSNVYIPCTYGTTLSNILNEMFVSSNNFIDEDGECLTYKEILEEINKFLGWTMTERDSNIYFIDVDYIKKGNNQYFKYNSDLSSVSITTLSTDKLNVQSIGSEGIDNSLSIIGGYNKINVVASDYEADKNNLYPELELNGSKIYKKEKEYDGYKFIKEYYNDSNFKFYTYKYNSSTKKFDSTTDGMFTGDMQHAGSIASQQANYQLDDVPNKLSFEKMVEIKSFDGNTEAETNVDYIHEYPENEILAKYPIIRLTKPSSSLVYDKDIKLAINFEIYFRWPSVWGEIDPTQSSIGGNDNFDINNVYVPVRLRCGEYWYDGTIWSKNSNNSFRIYTEIEKKAVINKWISAKNTNSFELGVNDLTGTIINFDKVIVGDLELIVYHPKFDATANYIFIKNLTIESQRVNFDTVKNDNSKKDTLYSNVVNEEFINEADDIELILTSKNESELSFSKIIYNENILDTIQNKITNSNEKPEKLIINRVINQYKQPKLKLLEILKPSVTPYQLITDNNLMNKEFIAINESIDYYNDSDEITLLEVN